MEVFNITYLDSNQLIDDIVLKRLIDKIIKEKLGKDYDKEGKLAFKGRVNYKKLDVLLKDDYLTRFSKIFRQNY